MAAEPPTYEDVVDAARRLRGRAVVTPLIRSPALDTATGARVAVKAESLQVSGSFKYRGAYTAIARLPDPVRARGVVA
jgi:threonine dehydratase